jgi:hypothetical protein
VLCYLSSPLTECCHSSFGFARLPVSTRSERQLSPQPRLNSAHPTSESADPRSRRGNPERGQSRPKSQASAYLPTTRPSEPCTPPRRPAHHRAEPQTKNTRRTRQQPALRGPVKSGAVGSEPKLAPGLRRRASHRTAPCAGRRPRTDRVRYNTLG